MPQPRQPSTAPPPLSGYITPIACQYCTAEAHLIQLSHHPELNARAAHFRMREVRQENRIDRSSIEGVRIEILTMNIRAVKRNGIPITVWARTSAVDT